jgi:hypothetical protein
MTIFMVVEADSGANGYLMFFGLNGTGDPMGFRDGTADLDLFIDGGTNDGPGYTQNAGDVIEYRTYLSDTAWGWYRKSNTEGSLVVAAPANLRGTGNPQTIGARADVALPATALQWEGRIAEIIGFSRGITNTEAIVVRDYLNDKYGL